MLVKKVSIDSFVYIQKNSFRMVDCKGLKQLQIIIINVIINTTRKYGYQNVRILFLRQSKLEHEKLLVNLTLDCWVTDKEIERQFIILNNQYDEVM